MVLRIHQTTSIDAAKSYFRDSLRRGDYYVGSYQPGHWRGSGSDLLGLTGEIGKEEFHALCENKHPATNERLTQRSVTNRRVGYDITFNCPKSVSILQGVIGDEGILKVFQDSVQATMERMERDAEVRVRRSGQSKDRTSGNLVWSEFIHTESRPVDGIPDPALHCHAYVFNASFDPIESRWKAGQFYRFLRDAPYYEAVFHSLLAQGLKEIGYLIRNQRYSFEVTGISREMIEAFSRRTHEIEKEARRLGVENMPNQKSQLGAMTRQRKVQPSTAKELREEWRKRLENFDSPSLEDLPERPVTATEAVDLAIEHSFERKSVVPRLRLIATALQLSLGSTTPTEIEEELEKRNDLLPLHYGETDYLTTEEVMEEELSIREFLQETQETCSHLGEASLYEESDFLDVGQRGAVATILNSKDRVVVVEGRAGTGKTTLMHAAVQGIESGGRRVYPFAPTSDAAYRVLRSEGFEKADTIQQLLVNKTLQNQIRGGVMWVDEAGLLSAPEMKQLLAVAESKRARVVLSGDTRQHHSVARGDSLRLIAQSGYVQVASISRIFRQRRKEYRDAVRVLSEGKVVESFARFERMGALKEVPEWESRVQLIAEDFLESRGSHDSILAVSPSKREGAILTTAIRAKLIQERKLGSIQVRRTTLVNRNLTLAEKRQGLSYRVGDTIEFPSKVGRRFDKGARLSVVDVSDSGSVIVEAGIEVFELNLTLAPRFQVYRSRVLDLAVGDQIRITENSFSTSGKKLHNGSIHRVVGFQNGSLALQGGMILPRDHQKFNYGYVATSHSSQGRTCGKVIVCQSSLSWGASSLEQFYVSVSRGRDEVAIFTDSKSDLLRAVRDSDERLLATEAVREKENLTHANRNGAASVLSETWEKER